MKMQKIHLCKFLYIYIYLCVLKVSTTFCDAKKIQKSIKIIAKSYMCIIIILCAKTNIQINLLMTK